MFLRTVIWFLPLGSHLSSSRWSPNWTQLPWEHILVGTVFTATQPQPRPSLSSPRVLFTHHSASMTSALFLASGSLLRHLPSPGQDLPFLFAKPCSNPESLVLPPFPHSFQSMSCPTVAACLPLWVLAGIPMFLSTSQQTKPLIFFDWINLPKWLKFNFAFIKRQIKVPVISNSIKLIHWAKGNCRMVSALEEYRFLFYYLNNFNGMIKIKSWLFTKGLCFWDTCAYNKYSCDSWSTWNFHGNRSHTLDCILSFPWSY